MSTWYKLSQYGKPKITPIECSKETAQFVTVIEKDWNGKACERRHLKEGEFFSSFEEARRYKIHQLEKAIQSNRDSYSQLMGHLKTIREAQENQCQQ